MVAQDHRVVQAQRQLQDTGDGVGHKRDLAQQEVAALIQDHGDNESQQQHRHLAIGLGGKKQHHDHDYRHINHDDTDLTGDGFLQGVAQVGGDIQIIAGEGILHRVQRRHAGVVILIVVKGDGVQRRRIAVMVGGLVEIHTLNALHIGNGVPQRFRRVIGNVVHHDICRSVGGELLFHYVQGLLRLGIIRQKGRQVVFHLHPVAGEHGKYQGDQRNQEKQIALIHDKRRQIFHECMLMCGLLFHGQTFFPPFL